MKKDEYGEVLNHQETYETLALQLSLGIPMMIGWTDGMMSHFDILFNYKALVEGNPQGGLRASDLYVSVMRKGAFGFEISKTDTHASYYGEKLMMGSGPTTDKLAELINGVKICLLQRSSPY